MRIFFMNSGSIIQFQETEILINFLLLFIIRRKL